MPKKLAEDHRRARKLGEGINKIPGLRVRGEVQTNIVIVDITAGTWTATGWWRSGVRLECYRLVESRAVRLVTHYEITDADIEQVLEVTEEIMHQALDLVILYCPLGCFAHDFAGVPCCRLLEER